MMENNHTIIISENLIPELMETFPHRKYQIVSKICDFCSKFLDKNHEGQQCFICSTFYDECSDCKEKNNYSRRICHKNHTIDNGVIPPDQLAVLEKEITVFTAMGITYAERHLGYIPETDSSEIFEMDMTEEMKCQLISMKYELPELYKIACQDHIKIYAGKTEYGISYFRLSLT